VAGPKSVAVGPFAAVGVVDGRSERVIAYAPLSTGPSCREKVAMKIVERQVGDVVILDLHGKILIGEGDDALREAVTKLADSGKTKILLNLADVPYVDSAGLGEIVRTYTTVSRKGGKLKLLNLTKKIQDLLSITKLLTVFETYEAEDEAVRSFK
jgi:anti-sigma B factor antagonist